MMRVWWVNQNQTFDEETRGGYLWSPKRKRDGSRNTFYDNMSKVKPGDIVLSFNRTFICSVGVIKTTGYSFSKPQEFGSTGAYWNADGWKVDVSYFPLSRPVKPKEHMNVLEELLPPKYSPLLANGSGVQSVYLAEVHERFASELLNLLRLAGNHLDVPLQMAESLSSTMLESESTIQPEVIVTPDLLSSAKTCTGLYRKLVLKSESRCRVSGVDNSRLLYVRHIQPWDISSDNQRIDVNNALTFAPNYAVMFTKGLISINQDGFVLHSQKVTETDYHRLGLPVDRKIWLGEFNQAQQAYLEAHRKLVFQS
jgi:putative restriction endonuclease